MTNALLEIFDEILEASRLHVEHISPSRWYETKMIMPRGSAYPGPFSFDLTPYWREPLDCAAKDHPAKEISIMKGAQLGGTVAVLNPIVGYSIAQNPGNIMFLTGHSDLSQAAVLKLDAMFDNCGMRDMIRPNIVRAKNTRSGDTDKLKEFAGGSLWAGSVTNHNLLRQYDVMVMIVDDFDAAPMSSKEAGATRELVQKRTSAYAHKKKIFYVSSPQLEGLSNIESVFNMGDKRYYNVPCPLCGSMIVLKWSIEMDNKEVAGIVWKTDAHGHLDRKSVGYRCQSCGKVFTESHKYEMNMAGVWVPTVIPIEENHQSYQISSLYSPPGMDDWGHYVQQYLNANPAGQKPIEKKYQTFKNVVLGEPYMKTGKANEANAVQKNIRTNKLGIVPEAMSIKDGSGKIIMLTCASDLNGKEDDARLDWEIVAWAENGSSYSVKHGSIGTFVPKETDNQKLLHREKWTYQHKKRKPGDAPFPSHLKSVWPELTEIISQSYPVDEGERSMRVLLTGVDTGHFTTHAYTFIDEANVNVIGLKGNKEDSIRKHGHDMPMFKLGQERSKLYLLDVNYIKDLVSEKIDLKWTDGDMQPPGFLNFPQPQDGLYGFNNFFKHYEAEHRVSEEKDGQQVGHRWVKKHSNDQNHFWDIYIYSFCLKEIWADMCLRAAKPPSKGNWYDFVAYLRLNKKI